MISTRTNGIPTLTMTKGELGLLLVQFQNEIIETILHNCKMGFEDRKIPDAEEFLNKKLLDTLNQ